MISMIMHEPLHLLVIHYFGYYFIIWLCPGHFWTSQCILKLSQQAICHNIRLHKFKLPWFWLLKHGEPADNSNFQKKGPFRQVFSSVKNWSRRAIFTENPFILQYVQWINWVLSKTVHVRYNAFWYPVAHSSHRSALGDNACSETPGPLPWKGTFYKWACNLAALELSSGLLLL